MTKLIQRFSQDEYNRVLMNFGLSTLSQVDAKEFINAGALMNRPKRCLCGFFTVIKVSKVKYWRRSDSASYNFRRREESADCYASNHSSLWSAKQRLIIVWIAYKKIKLTVAWFDRARGRLASCSFVDNFQHNPQIFHPPIAHFVDVVLYTPLPSLPIPE